MRVQTIRKRYILTAEPQGQGRYTTKTAPSTSGAMIIK